MLKKRCHYLSCFVVLVSDSVRSPRFNLALDQGHEFASALVHAAIHVAVMIFLSRVFSTTTLSAETSHMVDDAIAATLEVKFPEGGLLELGDLLQAKIDLWELYQESGAKAHGITSSPSLAVRARTARMITEAACASDLPFSSIWLIGFAFVC